MNKCETYKWYIDKFGNCSEAWVPDPNRSPLSSNFLNHSLTTFSMSLHRFDCLCANNHLLFICRAPQCLFHFLSSDIYWLRSQIRTWEITVRTNVTQTLTHSHIQIHTHICIPAKSVHSIRRQLNYLIFIVCLVPFHSIPSVFDPIAPLIRYLLRESDRVCQHHYFARPLSFIGLPSTENSSSKHVPTILRVMCESRLATY